MANPRRFAIVTIAVGDNYKKIFDYTRPTIYEYAERIDADFIEITQNTSSENPKKLKFILSSYLQSYERVLYLDGDIAINPICPDIFDLVPDDLFGATCEQLPYFIRDAMVKELCTTYKVNYPANGGVKFINSGLMMVSKIHQDIFRPPDQIIPVKGFYDQPYINSKLIDTGMPIYDLGLRFNHTGSFLLRGARPFGHGGAFIVHATGALGKYRLEYLKFVTTIWRKATIDRK